MRLPLVVMIAVAECASSHTVEPDAGADASPTLDASRLDATVRPDDAAVSDAFIPEIYEPGACTWGVGATHQLTTDRRALLIGSVTVTGDEVAVVWGAAVSPGAPTELTRLALDGTPIATSAPIATATPSYPHGAIGASASTRAWVGGDDTQCVFAPMSAVDDALTSPPVMLGRFRCSDLLPTSFGWGLLAFPSDESLAYVRLSGDGVVLGQSTLASSVLTPTPRLALSDGSFLATTIDPVTLTPTLRRYAEDGTALAAGTTLDGMGDLRTSHPVLVGDHARLVLSQYGTPSHLATLDVDLEGRPLGALRPMRDTETSRGVDHGVVTDTLGNSGGDVIVSWVTWDLAANQVGLRAQALAPDGAARAAALDLGSFPAAGIAPEIPYLVATPHGVLVVYFAVGAATPDGAQIWATELTCVP